MAPLKGVTGLNAAPANAPGMQYQDQGVLEAHGFSLDPSHGVVGDAAGQMWPASYGTGYSGTQYGSEVIQGQKPYYNVAGFPGDATPDTHCSPYPRGIIQPNLEQPGSYADAAFKQQVQNVELHGVSLGGDKKYNRNSPTGKEVPAHYTTDRYDAPNVNMLAQGVPGQIRGGISGNGHGWADTTQGYGELNSTEEFQKGHSIRRIQHDTMHFDHTLDNNPAVAFRGKFPVEQADFNVDSPYGPVLGVATEGAQRVWESHIGNPTSYQAPAEITVNQNPPTGDDVWAYG